MIILTTGLLVIIVLVIIITVVLIYAIPSKENLKIDFGDKSSGLHLMNTILVSKLPLAVQQEVKVPIKILKDLALPKSFDCRERWPGLISAPLNQGRCGSCWAFSTTTSASDRLRIATNGKVLNTPIVYDLYTNPSQPPEEVHTIDTLSPYHLAACNNCDILMRMGKSAMAKWMSDVGECNKECNGGIIPYAYHFISKIGLTAMSCEYKAGRKEKYICEPDITCPVYKGKTGVPEQDVFQLVGVDSIKKSLMLYGPVTVGFTVYQSFETFYKDPKNAKKAYPPVEQIKDGSWKDTVLGGHAVVCLAWDEDENGKEFWIIRNSWGSLHWGDCGYFRMYVGETGLEDDCYEIMM